MVHNRNSLLDESEIKYIDDIKEMKPKYIIEFEKKLYDARDICMRYEYLFKDKDINGKITFATRDEYNDASELMEAYENIQKDEFLKGFINFPGMDKHFQKGSETIAKYMGVIPFMPCVMINISPNWKGQFGQDPLVDEIMKDNLKEVLEKYLKASNRYSKYKYVIECGGDGDHLHAHAVAEINKGTEKSVMTHLNKGNHAVELRKIWKKVMPKGKEGLLKGKYAIQRIILRNEILVKDKLDYLIEEKKPEGHKNSEDLGVLVSVGF